MTMDTGDDELIISMERFASQLESVNCTEEYMAMTFTSNVTYEHAINSWEWVNANNNRTFIMIANHAGCGKDKSRSPWLVSNVYYEPSNLTVTLNSTKKTWEETAHSYALDFGHYAPPAPAAVQQNGSLAKRWTFDKSFPLDLTHQLPSDMFGAINTGDFNLAVSCPDCGTKGQLVLAGHVEVKFFGGLKSFTVSATPHGIAAALNLKVKVGGTLPMGGFSQTINLATLDLGGFSIPGILTLGPTFNIDAGFGLSSLTGSATFSTGISASIPDDSVAEVDLTGNKASDISGWTPAFVTQPLTVDAQIAVGMDVYTKLSIAASLLVLGNGFSVNLGLKVPDVTLKAIASVKQEGGVCDGSSKTIGVSLEAGIGAVLELQGFTEVLGDKHMFLNNPLFNSGSAFTFTPVCFPFGPDAVPSSATVITATTPAPTSAAAVKTDVVDASSSAIVSVMPINTSVPLIEIGPISGSTSSSSTTTGTISDVAAASTASPTAVVKGIEGGWNSTVEGSKANAVKYANHYGRHRRSVHGHLYGR